MVKKHEYGIGFWLIWIGILIIVIWILGKLLGLIHSPEIVNMTPFIGGVITGSGLGIMLGRMQQKINTVKECQDRIAQGLTKLERDFQKHLKK